MHVTGDNIPIELSETPRMNRGPMSQAEQTAHEPLLGEERADEHDGTHSDVSEIQETEEERPFSWLTYSIFTLLGVAMLWAWNMFLAAAPYFQRRFETDSWILNHFQAAEVSVANITNLITLLVLGNMQKKASYPKRVAVSLVVYTISFTILAISTMIYTSARTYFGFLLVIIVVTNTSGGLMQNGLFSFTVGFGRREYTQAIMTGQAIAGVLPPLTQILSVLAISPKDGDSAKPVDSWISAFVYFIAATIVSFASLVAFYALLRQKSRYDALQSTIKPDYEDTSGQRSMPISETTQKSVSLWQLFLKTPLLSLTVILCFAITMVFPVFTTKIQSTRSVNPALFIPLAFLMWNLGDLSGRIITLSPTVSLTHYPFALFCAAIARLIFIPLYFACNVGGRGAIIGGDFFYLVVVQYLFGLTNGYLGTTSIMAAGSWVAADEREAAGAFMVFCLILGLTIGSLSSFSLANI